MAIIRTPDQRVRVFISSTINELAGERKTAREAIEGLRLIPVFFEAGARPHPPRDLYSAYLEQSHIFLGIYWNSYGWIAPGAEISGLEDEYRLCGKKPRLIYVKVSDERDPNLNKLLSDIEKSETACYQFFSDEAQLKKLVENDLSVLMSEIFENALSEQQQASVKQPFIEFRHARLQELPHIKSEIFGRGEDLAKLSDLLNKPETSLVTLLGAGGTGKTTLSIHAAHRIGEGFSDGVAFIPLAPISDYKLVGTTIAEILGVQDSGKQPIEQTLIDYLSDKKFLLVLDNFEQVVEASKLISDIISRCKDVKILITSRTSLHIRNEHIFNLATLALPGENKITEAHELRNFPATQLFVERALEVNSQMQFSKENMEAIIEICERMDGLPLAIELAASRTRFFQPAALMSRIEKTLDLVSKGHKDLPERQQTLRAAIEWSYNLLTGETQQIFRQLGVFKRSWTMEAADVIVNGTSVSTDIEEMTERLLDVSLIKHVLVSHSAEPRFNMLQTVHEYALEMLEKSPEAEETKFRYACYFLDLCAASEGDIWGVNSEAWLDKLEYEYQNIRASFYFFLSLKKYEKAWNLFYFLVPYWTIRGGFSEGLKWIHESGMDGDNVIVRDDIGKVEKGRALVWAGFVSLMMLNIESGYNMLYRAQELLKDTGDETTMAFALILDGCYGVFMGKPDARQKVEEAFIIAEKLGDPLALSYLYTWSYEYFRQAGNYDEMYKYLGLARQIAEQNNFVYVLGTMYILKYSLDYMNERNDFEVSMQDSLEMYSILPEKGYKGLKSAALGGYAFSLLKLNRLDEVEAPLMRSLEYVRESGEKESEFWGVMAASYYFKMADKPEKASKLFGAVDAFIELTKYPIVGSAEVQYNETRTVVLTDESNPLNKRWYEEGKNMRMEDAVLYALKKDLPKTS